jgi:hypothetical protein
MTELLYKRSVKGEVIPKTRKECHLNVLHFLEEGTME